MSVPYEYTLPIAPFDWRGLAADAAGTVATLAVMAGILWIGVVA
jgi:hypothetical protein